MQGTCCCGCWGAAPLPWGPRDMLLAAAPPARRLPGPAGGSDDEVPATRLPCCTIMLLAGCIWPNGDACDPCILEALVPLSHRWRIRIISVCG